MPPNTTRRYYSRIENTSTPNYSSLFSVACGNGPSRAQHSTVFTGPFLAPEVVAFPVLPLP